MSTGGQLVSEDACAAALAEIEQLRLPCTIGNDGCAVLQCLVLCLSHAVPAPDWLRSEFIRRHTLVKDAYVMSWDDAFGRFWPPRTRLPVERRHREEQAKVHGAVWALLQANPDVPFGRIGMFDVVGAMGDIKLSASEAEKRYYQAIDAGYLNLADWRLVALRPGRPSRTKRRKVKDETPASTIDILTHSIRAPC
jgi:hypothetical protein